MNHFRRGCLVVVAMLCALTTLSACGKAPAASRSSTVTITFWHGMSGAHKQALNHIIHAFNQSQTAYKVVGESQGNFANLQQKITAAAKAQTLPTMAQTAYTNVPDYVKGGFVTAFDPYVNQSALRNVYPIFLQASRYQGKTYALPFAKSARILFYNKDLLKQTGLRVPKTWATIQKDGQRVQAQGLTAIAFDQSIASDLSALAVQAGQPVISDQLTVNANRPKTVAATKVIWDMLQAKTATTAGTDGYGSTQFFKGKTLFYSGSSAAIGIMQASTPKGMHWGTAVMPSYQGHHAASIAGNDVVLFKSASTAQRKGAAAFMKFLLRDKQTIYWAKKTGYVPLTKTAQHRASYRQYLANHPTAKAALKSLPHGFQDPAFLGYSQYFTALNQASDKMVADHVKPLTALTTLQRQATKIIEQNQDK